jgi:transposase
MTRLYGRAIGGERVYDYVPDIRFERYSILSTVRANGDMIPLVFGGTLNGELFKKYIEKFVVPTLKPRDILALDNLSSHKVKGIAEMVENADVNVVYLPQYSPDLNPIETIWAEMKSVLRKLKARTFDAICDTVNIAIDSITEKHAIGHFLHRYCSL